MSRLPQARPLRPSLYKSGGLALDHTTLHTETAGYETRRSTITETKTIGQLSSNDMSYIPATAVKNGKTLSLASVEWQVSGTALVGEELVPSEFQTIATYTGSSSYQAATGYQQHPFPLPCVGSGSPRFCGPGAGSRQAN